jgi:hypothetical protein
MSLASKKTAGLKTYRTVKAVRRARAASSAAAANSRDAAQNAVLAAQNAAGLAQLAAQNAAVLAASAAQNAGGAAQTAASGVSRGVRQGVYTARSWAAPRLDSAADYCTTTVAPMVSSALRSTARQVAPADTRSTRRSSILTWSLLGAAIAAALGAAAAVARYRYSTAIDADSEAGDEEEVLGDSTGGQATPVSSDGSRPAAPPPTDPGRQDPGKQDPGKQDPGKQDPGKQNPGKQNPGKQDPGSDTSANGRVRTSGW